MLREGGRRQDTMNKKIILFGAGFYGKSAYFKMKEQYEIVFLRIIIPY